MPTMARNCDALYKPNKVRTKMMAAKTGMIEFHPNINARSHCDQIATISFPSDNSSFSFCSEKEGEGFEATTGVVFGAAEGAAGVAVAVVGTATGAVATTTGAATTIGLAGTGVCGFETTGVTDFFGEIVFGCS